MNRRNIIKMVQLEYIDQPNNAEQNLNRLHNIAHEVLLRIK